MCVFAQGGGVGGVSPHVNKKPFVLRGPSKKTHLKHMGGNGGEGSEQ